MCKKLMHILIYGGQCTYAIRLTISESVTHIHKIYEHMKTLDPHCTWPGPHHSKPY